MCYTLVMKVEKYLQSECESLQGKVVAVTGSTGGLGEAICRYVAMLGGQLILLNRNKKKTKKQIAKLKEEFGVSAKFLQVDMADIFSVKNLCQAIGEQKLDYLILNAGAYSLPREKSALGLDNVFQINFASPYLLCKKLLPNLQGGRVIAVGSIAHKFSKIKTDDIDFSWVKAPRKVYGNAKRFLMFSLEKLLQKSGVEYTIAHPGITPTNITSHYPKWIRSLIKYPMKWIFTNPHKAGLNIIQAMFAKPQQNQWVGPRIFNIWGRPKTQRLKTCKEDEKEQIFEIAEEIYKKGDKIMHHSLGVQEKYYNLIMSGEKVYEGRLNDEKRRAIVVGDIITIQKDPERAESFDVRVVDKICFKNFLEMAENLGTKPLGFNDLSPEEVAKIYQEFYSTEKQLQFGVVAIGLKKV